MGRPAGHGEALGLGLSSYRITRIFLIEYGMAVGEWAYDWLNLIIGFILLIRCTGCAGCARLVMLDMLVVFDIFDVLINIAI